MPLDVRARRGGDEAISADVESADCGPAADSEDGKGHRRNAQSLVKRLAVLGLRVWKVDAWFAIRVLLGIVVVCGIAIFCFSFSLSGNVDIVFDALAAQLASKDTMNSPQSTTLQLPHRQARHYTGPSGNKTLVPLPINTGIDEALSFLEDAKAGGDMWRSPCSIARIDRSRLKIRDFIDNWQHKRPFILPNISSIDGSVVPSFDRRLLYVEDHTQGKISSEGHNVVMDFEFGTLDQRRATGYKRCKMHFRDILDYWTTPADDMQPGLLARVFTECGAMLDEQVAAVHAGELKTAKRTVYGRLNDALHHVIKPIIQAVPFWPWVRRAGPKGSEPTAKSWISTVGARTPAHTDATYQFLTQLWGHKYFLLFPSTTFPDVDSPLLKQVAEYPGLPDPALLPWLRDADVPFIQRCILAPGDSIYIPPGIAHDVFTLTDSYTSVVRWDDPFSLT